jgi:hypothetical protein
MQEQASSLKNVVGAFTLDDSVALDAASARPARPGAPVTHMLASNAGYRKEREAA